MVDLKAVSGTVTDLPKQAGVPIDSCKFGECGTNDAEVGDDGDLPRSAGRDVLQCSDNARSKVMPTLTSGSADGRVFCAVRLHAGPAQSLPSTEGYFAQVLSGMSRDAARDRDRFGGLQGAPQIARVKPVYILMAKPMN